MKSSLYTYQDEAKTVTLQFSFPIGEKEREQKIAYLKLMEQACKDLTEELNMITT